MELVKICELKTSQFGVISDKSPTRTIERSSLIFETTNKTTNKPSFVNIGRTKHLGSLTKDPQEISPAPNMEPKLCFDSPQSLKLRTIEGPKYSSTKGTSKQKRWIELSMLGNSQPYMDINPSKFDESSHIEAPHHLETVKNSKMRLRTDTDEKDKNKTPKIRLTTNENQDHETVINTSSYIKDDVSPAKEVTEEFEKELRRQNYLEKGSQNPYLKDLQTSHDDLDPEQFIAPETESEGSDPQTEPETTSRALKKQSRRELLRQSIENQKKMKKLDRFLKISDKNQHRRLNRAIKDEVEEFKRKWGRDHTKLSHEVLKQFNEKIEFRAYHKKFESGSKKSKKHLKMNQKIEKLIMKKTPRDDIRRSKRVRMSQNTSQISKRASTRFTSGPIMSRKGLKTKKKNLKGKKGKVKLGSGKKKRLKQQSEAPLEITTTSFTDRQSFVSATFRNSAALKKKNRNPSFGEGGLTVELNNCFTAQNSKERSPRNTYKKKSKKKKNLNNTNAEPSQGDYDDTDSAFLSQDILKADKYYVDRDFDARKLLELKLKKYHKKKQKGKKKNLFFNKSGKEQQKVSKDDNYYSLQNSLQKGRNSEVVSKHKLKSMLNQPSGPLSLVFEGSKVKGKLGSFEEDSHDIVMTTDEGRFRVKEGGGSEAYISPITLNFIMNQSTGRVNDLVRSAAKISFKKKSRGVGAATGKRSSRNKLTKLLYSSRHKKKTLFN